LLPFYRLPAFSPFAVCRSHSLLFLCCYTTTARCLHALRLPSPFYRCLRITAARYLRLHYGLYLAATLPFLHVWRRYALLYLPSLFARVTFCHVAVLRTVTVLPLPCCTYCVTTVLVTLPYCCSDVNVYMYTRILDYLVTRTVILRYRCVCSTCVLRLRFAANVRSTCVCYCLPCSLRSCRLRFLVTATVSGSLLITRLPLQRTLRAVWLLHLFCHYGTFWFVTTLRFGLRFAITTHVYDCRLLRYLTLYWFTRRYGLFCTTFVICVWFTALLPLHLRRTGLDGRFLILVVLPRCRTTRITHTVVTHCFTCVTCRHRCHAGSTTACRRHVPHHVWFALHATATLPTCCIRYCSCTRSCLRSLPTYGCVTLLPFGRYVLPFIRSLPYVVCYDPLHLRLLSTLPLHVLPRHYPVLFTVTTVCHARYRCHLALPLRRSPAVRLYGYALRVAHLYYVCRHRVTDSAVCLPRTDVR